MMQMLIPISGFYWPFVAILVVAGFVPILGYMVGGLYVRFKIFLGLVFWVFTWGVMRQHVEMGYEVLPGKNWLVRDFGVLIQIGGRCLLALALGTLLGTIVVGLLKGLAVVGRAIEGWMDSTARFLEQWVFTPLGLLIGFLIKPIANRVIERIQWRRKAS